MHIPLRPVMIAGGSAMEVGRFLLGDERSILESGNRIHVHEELE